MIKEVWIHALGAKVGGGRTYLDSLLPELARQLTGQGRRVVLLLPREEGMGSLPAWIECRSLHRVSRRWITRLLFDQIVLPLWLLFRPGAVLYCSGSFAPVVKVVPTVTLLRNAIYFDPDLLQREVPFTRALLRLQGFLIAFGAAGSVAVHYPSRSMRTCVERAWPSLRRLGCVNTYGIHERFVEAGKASGASSPMAEGPFRFLYVMTYTIQKNLTVVLRALAKAREERLPIRVIVTSNLEGGPRATAAEDRRIIDENDLVGSGYLAPSGGRFGQELVDLYRSVDACIFPSICESFGHPLVEALAIGKPLVCADRPYARELCGEHALYVDPDDPQALVDVWRAWPAPAEKLPRMPIDTLSERFSWARHVGDLLRALGIDGSDERPSHDVAGDASGRKGS